MSLESATSLYAWPSKSDSESVEDDSDELKR
jgi:hypothetical protein